MKTSLIRHALTLIAIALPFASAYGAEVDTILVRGKAGPSFYTGFDPIGSAFGLGLDLGFRAAQGYGLVALGRMNLQGNGSESTGTTPTTTVTTRLKTLFLGVAPTYTVTKGIANLTFGLGVGVLSLSSDSTTTVSGFGGSSGDSPTTTSTRFGLSPSVDVDIEIAAGLFGNIGVQYLLTFGDSPKPGVISPMAGVGYHF